MSEITVTQADRIAWADYEDFEGAFRERVLSGSEDRTDGLLRFARHRQEARKAALEEAAEIAFIFAPSSRNIGIVQCELSNAIRSAIA